MTARRTSEESFQLGAWAGWALAEIDNSPLQNRAGGTLREYLRLCIQGGAQAEVAQLERIWKGIKPDE